LVFFGLFWSFVLLKVTKSHEKRHACFTDAYKLVNVKKKNVKRTYLGVSSPVPQALPCLPSLLMVTKENLLGLKMQMLFIFRVLGDASSGGGWG
jgi:hypothetical protein